MVHNKTISFEELKQRFDEIADPTKQIYIQFDTDEYNKDRDLYKRLVFEIVDKVKDGMGFSISGPLGEQCFKGPYTASEVKYIIAAICYTIDNYSYMLYNR